MDPGSAAVSVHAPATQRAPRIHTIRRSASPTAHSLHAAANLVRTDHRLSPFEWDTDLAAAASDHARDLIATGRFSHTGSDGSTALARAYRHSQAWCGVGENLAIGQLMACEVVDGWLGSPGHRANLLRAGFTHAGAAVVRPPRSSPFAAGLLWVQVYGAQSPSGQAMAAGPLSEVLRLLGRLVRGASELR